jgi:hypothetical protein
MVEPKRKPTIYFALALISSHFLGCEGKTISLHDSGIETEIRADAVHPKKRVDVVYEVGVNSKQMVGVEPGTKIGLGKVKAGTIVRLWVKNSNGAGFIRANILTKNCFRKTGSCDTLNCVAYSEYTVVEESCLNH